MALTIEVLADGGIRVAAPGSQAGLATLPMAMTWTQVAADRGWPVTLCGDAGSPVAGRLIAEATSKGATLTTSSAPPAPWPRSWTSLQIAASSGLVEQVADLLGRGAATTARRRDESPYRLAMRHGHVGVMVALRAAGVTPPPGSQPPNELPDAVVLRNYLPGFIWWVAIGAAIVGVVLAIALQQWPFLIVAGFGAAAILVANLVIGRTRIAIDGPRLSVRQVVRWQGPIDLRELVAVGFWKAISRRMSSRWRFVQTAAGPGFGPTAHDGFEPPLAERLDQVPGLRVITLYCGRGFLSPGFERHLAANVTAPPTVISAAAQAALAAAVPQSGRSASQI